MQRKFLSNLSLLLILNLLIKPAYLLLIETEVQNRVGAEIFGNYAALLSLTFLLNIFLDLGINTFTSRTLAQKHTLASNYLSPIIGLRTLLMAAYFILLFGAAWLLGYQENDFQLLAWLGINQMLAASVLYIRSNLSGLLLFKRDAIISVLDRGLMVLGIGYLLFFGTDASFDIYYLVWGQTAAYAVALVVAVYFLLPHLGKVKIRWRPMFNRVILKQSLPYALLVLLMMVYYKTDSVMLERLLPNGDYHAGVYAMAYRIFEASNMLGYLFATLLLPLFSKAFKEGDQPSELASNAFRLILFGGVTLAVTCAIWRTEILSLLYDNEIDQAAPCFLILMCAFFFMLMSYLWGTLLTANGDMKVMNQIATGAVVLNITLNYFLIPDYQETGSAVASLFTQILVASFQFILSYRLTKVRLERKVWIRSMVFLILVGILAWSSTIITLQWQLMLVSFVLILTLGAFATGLLRPVYVKSLLGKSD